MDNKKISTIWILACFLIIASILKTCYNNKILESYKDELELPPIPKPVDFQKPVQVNALLLNKVKKNNPLQRPTQGPTQGPTQSPIVVTDNKKLKDKKVTFVELNNKDFKPIIVLGTQNIKPQNLGYNWLHRLAKNGLLEKLINKNTKEQLYKDKWISILRFLGNNIKNVELLQELNRYLYFLDHLDKFNVPKNHKFRDFDGSISILDVRQYSNQDINKILNSIFVYIKLTKLNDKQYDIVVDSALDVYKYIMKSNNSYYI